MVQVKVFDCEHEKDLEEEMNAFLSGLNKKDIIDVKYHIAAIGDPEDEQVYCFSAMVLYIKAA
ncbi:sporulation protein Cse60 [Lederbergia graminis]|uniref:Sporulation protein Cse60 n=1 Tax=Lederbergia graminis TaxID=735518 RepID=A0ABW0LF37_9BACI|nr:sporulation protein Cse60 [Paenibacillus bovis]